MPRWRRARLLHGCPPPGVSKTHTPCGERVPCRLQSAAPVSVPHGDPIPRNRLRGPVSGPRVGPCVRHRPGALPERPCQIPEEDTESFLGADAEPELGSVHGLTVTTGPRVCTFKDAGSHGLSRRPEEDSCRQQPRASRTLPRAPAEASGGHLDSAQGPTRSAPRPQVGLCSPVQSRAPRGCRLGRGLCLLHHP